MTSDAPSLVGRDRSVACRAAGPHGRRRRLVAGVGGRAGDHPGDVIVLGQDGVMCDQCRDQNTADRALWITVRRALLMIVAAIEARHRLREKQNRAA